MHRTIISTMTLAVILLTATLAWATVEVPTDMRLGPPEGMKASKTEVAFSHQTHDAAKIECTTCHHTWDGKSDVQSCATAGCHDQKGKKGVHSFYLAFHNKKSEASCLGCHKVMKKQGQNVPVSCKSCHPK